MRFVVKSKYFTAVIFAFAVKNKRYICKNAISESIKKSSATFKSIAKYCCESRKNICGRHAKNDFSFASYQKKSAWKNKRRNDTCRVIEKYVGEKSNEESI